MAVFIALRLGGTLDDFGQGINVKSSNLLQMVHSRVFGRVRVRTQPESLRAKI